MWAFLCGVVSVGALNSNNTILILSGLLLAGPLVCGMSQAVNDWCDRHVDAINQPERPIPSGRVSAGWGFFTGHYNEWHKYHFCILSRKSYLFCNNYRCLSRLALFIRTNKTETISDFWARGRCNLL